MEKVRIQLDLWEVKYLRNLLARDYNFQRRNLRYERKHLAQGHPDSKAYPVAEQEKSLKRIGRLLRKLHKHTHFKHRWDVT